MELYKLNNHEMELIRLMRNSKPFDEITIAINQNASQWTFLQTNKHRVVIKVVQEVVPKAFMKEEELIESA